MQQATKKSYLRLKVKKSLKSRQPMRIPIRKNTEGKGASGEGKMEKKQDGRGEKGVRKRKKRGNERGRAEVLSDFATICFQT